MVNETLNNTTHSHSYIFGIPQTDILFYFLIIYFILLFVVVIWIYYKDNNRFFKFVKFWNSYKYWLIFIIFAAAFPMGIAIIYNNAVLGSFSIAIASTLGLIVSIYKGRLDLLEERQINKENIIMQLEHNKELFFQPKNENVTLDLIEKIASLYEDFEINHFLKPKYGNDFDINQLEPRIDYTLEDIIKRRFTIFEKNYDAQSDFYKGFIWKYGESIFKEFIKFLKSPKKFVYLDSTLKVIIRGWVSNFKDIKRAETYKLSLVINNGNIEEKKVEVDYSITFHNKSERVDLKTSYKLSFRDLMIICIFLEKEQLRILFNEFEPTDWKEICDLFINEDAGFLEISKEIYPEDYEKPYQKFFNAIPLDILSKDLIDDFVDRFLKHLKEHEEENMFSSEN